VGKGAGSVVNGYESITGQINVELQKPEDSEKLYLNAYLNDMGRAEINLNSAHKLKKRWSTGFLLHSSRLGNELGSMDRNKDGFLDTPMFTQYNGINRWKYEGDRLKAQFGVKALYENRRGGQMAFYDKNMPEVEPEMVFDPVMGHEMPVDAMPPTPYGTGSTVRRVEAFSKTGIIFPQTPYKGIGLVTSVVNHEQDGFFGLNTYRGRQRTLYANLIYQSIIGTTDHGVKMGASYLLDDYQEAYRDSAFARTESVPGVFGEYTWTSGEKFTAVAGLRADFHNLYGPILTPRLHLKYSLTPTTALRASAGSGFRVPNPIAENTPALVSSRQLVVNGNLLPEKAWNYGASLTHDFTALGRNAVVSFDFYRTDFTNQLVMDMDTDPGKIMFYNLDGKSFANSAQAEVQFQPVKRMDVKAAYKFYDVRTTIGDKLIRRPFVSRHRLLFNVGYATKFDKWKFDFTTQFIGAKRIPVKFSDAGGNRPDTFSPNYALMNAQITRSFRKWDVYLGGENLGDFRQPDPIIGADQPFGPEFDSSLIWGPVYGRMIYAGMRFKIK
jgi:outer membrane receptor protein involved in Fe transport